ncbi:MAG: hypothetical protein RL318_1318 [Fibrobacterota bacterium]|jgi:hypothetical protein
MTLRFPALPRFFRIAIAGVGLAFAGGQWACTDMSEYREGRPPPEARLSGRMVILDSIPSKTPWRELSQVALTSRWSADASDFAQHPHLLQVTAETDTGRIMLVHTLTRPDDSLTDTLICYSPSIHVELFRSLGDSQYLTQATLTSTGMDR